MGEIAVGEPEELESTLEDAESLAIVCHYQPDPDCLASAYALEWIATQNGVNDTDIFYQGHITHQEIRSFISIFDIELNEIDDTTFEEYDLVAFVDHSISGTKVRLPSSVSADVVIDNMESAGEPDASFVDTGQNTARRRQSSRSTSPAGTRNRPDWSPPRCCSPSTASDWTTSATRPNSTTERRSTCSRTSISTSSRRCTVRRSHPKRWTPWGRAIHHRTMRGSVLVSSIGQTPDSGALPQAADYLLRLEGIRTVLVIGIVNGDLWLSARSFDPRIDIGAILNGAFSDFGTAGGHQDRAGGQVSLGIFADSDMDSPAINERLFVDIVSERFFKALALEED